MYMCTSTNDYIYMYSQPSIRTNIHKHIASHVCMFEEARAPHTEDNAFVCRATGPRGRPAQRRRREPRERGRGLAMMPRATHLLRSLLRFRRHLGRRRRCPNLRIGHPTMAFSTGSEAACTPTTSKQQDHKLKLRRSTASDVIPTACAIRASCPQEAPPPRSAR